MNVLINVIKLIIDSNNASVQLTKKKSFEGCKKNNILAALQNKTNNKYLQK